MIRNDSLSANQTGDDRPLNLSFVNLLINTLIMVYDDCVGGAISAQYLGIIVKNNHGNLFTTDIFNVT